MPRRLCVVVALLWGARATADDPTSLIARGEELGKQGEFSRAIQLFKQADTLAPSAANACRIGLAYTRRELWPQAELFFELCRKRATTADPVPEWLTDAQAQLAQKLSESDAATIDVRVDPAAARITVSSFPPDEQFAPHAIHLTPGSYTITATAPGREPAHAAITVESHTGQIITLVLPRPPPPPPPPPTRDQQLGRALLLGAGGLAIAGVAFHGLATYERAQLDDASAVNDPVAWDHHAGTFEAARAITIGCYGVAITAAIVGAVLRTHGPTGPVVTGAVGDHSAVVGVEWRR